MSKSPKKKQPSYGEAAARLEEILQKIEEGEVDIDELSGLVEEAAGLVTLCRRKIQAAEVQVRTITEQLERDEAETPVTVDDDSRLDDSDGSGNTRA